MILQSYSPCLDELNEWISPLSQRSLSSLSYNDTQVNMLSGAPPVCVNQVK